MSDDIERLLAEVNKTTDSRSASGSAPARSSRSEVESAKSAGGRLAFAVIAAAVFGVVGFVTGLFVPFFIGGFSTGVGASIGAFLTALVAGPPRWFSS
jgi:hypothetical protein